MGRKYRYATDRYTTFVRGDGLYVCTCPAAHYRDEPCKHVMELIRMGLDFNLDDMFLQTDLAAVNDLLGGLPIGTLTGIFGTPGAAKSTLSFQLACNFVQQEERPAVIIDTEGSMHTYASWWETFQKRYGLGDAEVFAGRYHYDRKSKEYHMEVPEKVPAKSITIIDNRNIRGILHMHGRGVNINVKDKKLQVLHDSEYWVDDPFDSPLGTWMVQNGAGFVSYDSISMPLKEIGIESQNLPQRSELTGYWMGPAQVLFQELNLCGTAVMHYMKNPTNQWDTPSFEGGKMLGHSFKYVLEMDESRKNTIRRVRVWRHPTKKRFDETAYLMFTPTGLVDTEDY